MLPIEPTLLMVAPFSSVACGAIFILLFLFLSSRCRRIGGFLFYLSLLSVLLFLFPLLCVVTVRLWIGCLFVIFDRIVLFLFFVTQYNLRRRSDGVSIEVSWDDVSKLKKAWWRIKRSITLCEKNMMSMKSMIYVIIVHTGGQSFTRWIWKQLLLGEPWLIMWELTWWRVCIRAYIATDSTRLVRLTKRSAV